MIFFLPSSFINDLQHFPVTWKDMNPPTATVYTEWGWTHQPTTLKHQGKNDIALPSVNNQLDRDTLHTHSYTLNIKWCNNSWLLVAVGQRMTPSYMGHKQPLIKKINKNTKSKLQPALLKVNLHAGKKFGISCHVIVFAKADWSQRETLSHHSGKIH